MSDALRASEELRRILFEQAPVGVFAYDRDLRLTACNPRFVEILRSSLDRLIGLDLRTLRFQPVLVPIQKALEGEVTFYEGPYVATTSSAEVAVSLRLAPVRDARGAVIGGMGFVEDVTERKLMQARLLHADRMVSVGTLAAGVAHEINNPLAYVIANLDLIAARRLPELVRQIEALGGAAAAAAAALAGEVGEVAEMVRVARDGAERVRHVVGDLRTFSRPDDEEAKQVDVRRVLEASVSLAWNEIRHRATLVKEYGEAPPVAANEARLGQVFLNLLVNAAQALPFGSAQDHRIRVVTGTCEGGRALVEISDTGEGIPPEVLPRIFDPFFTTKPVGVGTGLGLWICQGIVASLGGEIEVESEAGRGTTFRVYLPAADGAPAKEAPSGSPAPSGAKRGRILVVDDEPAIGRALARLLSDEHDVVAALSGREALEILRKDDRFDVILCDLMMPDTTGEQVHDALARDRPDLALRIVFATGGAFSGRMREFLERVPNVRLEKPFDSERLLALLRRRVGG